ncbi:MAG TPA: fructose-6-phosphate aldolase [Dehalococcoidia bacterium]|nr:fructose-6-phosphate aldolase [Dehalococcoidia bacterium]
MRIFLDTANVEEIQEAVRWGVCDGVTTNPSLFAKESGNGVTYQQRIQEIAAIVDGPISAECVSRTADELVAEARELASWHPNVVVKIPVDEAGLEAISRVSAEGIRVNTTLIFSVNQALLAANAGAAYVSPFIGRLDDIGQDGMVLVRETLELFDQYHMTTQLIAASVRHTGHVQACAAAGAHIATVPSKVLKQMVKHPLTDKGIDAFLADWEKAHGAPVA